MSEKILLIDGHSILNRAFYGVPMLNDSKGRPTNAVYGFLNILFKVIDEEAPTHAAVAFDLKGPTFRHKMYKEYKGTRKPMPKELHEQVPMIRGVLEAMGIKTVSREGFEADDCLGTLSKRARKSEIEPVILSGDRDLLQLVDDHITLRLPRTSKGVTTVERFTPEHVYETYGIRPDQVVDLKAMMGDSSDNIPGLPGVGEKTAVSLLQKYDNLENIHSHTAEITPKKAHDAFENSFELALLSQKLAKIDTDVPLEASFEELKLGNLYTEEAYALFREYGFRNLLPRFDDTARNTDSLPEIKMIKDITEADAAFASLAKKDLIGAHLYISNGAAGAFAAACDDGLYYIAVSGDISAAYLHGKVKNLYEHVRALSVFSFKEQQNILDINQRDRVFDCSVAAYLLDPLKSSYTYDFTALTYAGITLPSEEELKGEKNKEPDEETIKLISAYTAYGAFVSKAKLEKALEEKGMYELFTDVEMPCAFVLSEMERTGIRILKDALAAYSERLGNLIEETEAKIYDQAGDEFNINSPKQLGSVLFEKLKLPGGKKTKSGYSTAADVLEKLKEDSPIIEDILLYRQLSKLKSTYGDVLGKYADENDRIHTHFQQTVTATGRLSSTDPNLQNIPVRMEAGREIRKVFAAKEGCVFTDADYSQIELRVMAHLSGDKALIEAYRQAKDIHAQTAAHVFGVDIKDVTPLMRRNAKAVNFGIIYGISSFGLSQDLSISRKEAQKQIDGYFEAYPGVKKYLDETVEKAKKDGFTRTLFGRIRPIPELSSGNFMQRSFGMRVAMNSPIQGTAADIIKIAMVRVAARLKNEGLKTKLVLQVHDELLLEGPEDEVGAVSGILNEEMTHAAELSVPLEIDLHTGKTWDEAH